MATERIPDSAPESHSHDRSRTDDERRLDMFRSQDHTAGVATVDDSDAGEAASGGRDERTDEDTGSDRSSQRRRTSPRRSPRTCRKPAGSRS